MQIELNLQRQIIDNEAKDWAETDTVIRNSFRNIYDNEYVDGDTYGVTPLEALVERAVRDVVELKAKLSKVKEFIPYQKCPKCDGQGSVNKPPFIAGDQERWDTSELKLYTCDVCKGKKIIPMMKELPWPQQK